MTLPPVAAELPKTLESDHAKRIQQFLVQFDRRIEEVVELFIYGSAAVSIFLADDSEYERGYTADVDIGLMKPESVGTSVSPDVVEPPLRFQTHPVTQWLVHPDWQQDVLDASELLGTSKLRVQFLHPIDLILSKLERFSPQDVEDGILLRRRYVSDTDTVVERLQQAWTYYPGSRRARQQVEAAFESVFELQCHLE